MTKETKVNHLLTHNYKQSTGPLEAAIDFIYQDTYDIQCP